MTEGADASLGSRPRSSSSKIAHIPALDGLRGCALLGVLFFHADKALPGGYLGVDLFFVLSGYLITSLLLAEHAKSGVISLTAFWIRRARRLFPALLSLLPAIALYSYFLAEPESLARIRGDALATLGYIANWRMVLSDKSYWELFSAPSPLEHTWSLAIEEQFYVAWPILVMLVAPRSKSASRRVLFLSLILAVASVLAMLLLYQPLQTGRVYLGTDTRSSGILAGAALATLLSPSTDTGKSSRRHSMIFLDALGIVSIVGLAFAWWRIEGHDRFLYRGGFWVTEIAALVLIACAVRRTPLIARILSLRPLAFIGTISYGLYLWHWPINVVLTADRTHLSAWLPLTALRFAVTFAISILSYRFLEKPIRERGLPFGRPLILVPSAIVLAVLLIVGGTRARASTAPPRSTFVSAAPIEPKKADVADQDASSTTEPPYEILIFGDSTANSLGWTMRGVRRSNVEIQLLGRDGCTMLYDSCYGDKWAEQARTEKPNANLLFLGGAFQHEMEDESGHVIQACYSAWHAKFEKVVVERLHDLLQGGGPDIKVFVATVPLGLKYSGGAVIDRQIGCINESIRKLPDLVPGITLIDLAERVCPKGKCLVQEEGMERQMRPDGLHYDMEGARLVSSWMLDELGAKQKSEEGGSGAPPL